MPGFAVLLGTTVAVSVKFHDVDPLASLLLLPFLAYATYGTLLLSLSLDSLSTEVRKHPSAHVFASSEALRCQLLPCKDAPRYNDYSCFTCTMLLH